MEGQEVNFFKNPQKKIRIGIIEGVLINWFISRVVDIAKDSPYQLDIQIDHSQNLIQELERSEIDVFIGTQQIQTGILSSQKLFKESFKIIHKEGIDLKNLYQYPWIVYSETDPLMSLKKKSESIITVNSLFTMRRLVEEGLGIAVLPEHSIPKNSKLKMSSWNRLKSDIYLTTQNYQVIPEWRKDFKSFL